jgi:hypothetical protein
LVEADPAAVDVPDEGAGADDDDAAGCEDDPALACDALTEPVTGADGPPECEAMQPVFARASAATAQPMARARRTLTRTALKVSIGTDPGTAAAGL